MTTTIATIAAVLLMAGPLAAQQTKPATRPKTTATAGTGNTLEQNSAVTSSPDNGATNGAKANSSGSANDNANGTKAASAPNTTLEQNSAANAPSGTEPTETDARSSTTTTGKGVKARTKRDKLVNLKPNDPK